MYFLTRIRAALAAWDVILLFIALTVAAFHVWPGWLLKVATSRLQFRLFLRIAVDRFRRQTCGGDETMAELAVSAAQSAPNRVVTRAYSDNIEIARGTAAFYVVLFHAYIWYLNPAGRTLFQTASFQEFFQQDPLTVAGALTVGFGFLGVNLFFVVSGYCIHIGNAARGVQKLNFGLFLARRLARLYPLYLAVTIFLFVYWGPYRGEWEQNAINWQNFIGHLFFWHYLGASNSAGMGISGVMWTIALEVQFYLLYALSFPLLRKVGFGRSALVLLGIGFVYHACEALLVDYPLIFFPSRLSPMRFGEWLLGAWLAELHVRGEIWRFRTPALLIGGGIIVAGVIAGYTLGMGMYGSTDIPAAIGFFLILGYMLNAERVKRSASGFSMIARAVGRWLGERCYSIYLVHATVLYIGSAYIHIYLTSAPLSKTILAIALVLIVSDIVYRLIEAPSHRLSRMIG